MKTRLMIAAVMIFLSASAFATWSVTDDGGGFVVRNGRLGEPGTTKIKVDSQKKGERLANELNSIEEDDKESDKKDKKK